VLVDSGDDYYRAYELTLEQEGLKLSPREVMLREGRRTSEVIAALYADRGIELSQSKLDELVARRLGFYKQTTRGIFFEGIWRLVGALRAAGYKLGIVTGSSRIHDVLPLSAENEKLFDVVVTADDIQRPKPDPQPFQVASERIGLAPANCVVVENAPLGIEAAHRAGCRAVAICTTLYAEDLREADWIVANHRELELLLRS
jgi:beta-phosphoglucomutase